jgi:hypothetical protein
MPLGQDLRVKSRKKLSSTDAGIGRDKCLVSPWSNDL